MASGLEAELNCAICLDFYTNPHILPCQHSFCNSCLSKVLRAPPSPGTAILCPSCRKNFAIGKEGVSILPRNFMLASIVDKFKESKVSTERKAKAQMATPCDLCDGVIKGTATKHCIQCGASYCERCFQVCHPMRGPLAKHSIKTPVEAAASSPKATITCPNHEGKELDMYCVPCERPICYLCDRVGGHHEHKVCDIQTAFTQRKANVIQRASNLQEKKKQQDSFIQELQEGQVICKNNYAQVDRDVSKEFEKLLTILKATEKRVKSDLAQRKQQKIATLTTKIQATAIASDKIVEISKRIEDVLKESDPVAFLLYASLLEKSLKDSEDVQVDLMPPVGYDFSLIRNYDKCLESVETLTYDGVKVFQARFDTVNKTNQAVIERNKMHYEKSENEELQFGETVYEQEGYYRKSVMMKGAMKSKAIFRQHARSQYLCAATLCEPLSEGYNYVEIRIQSTSQNQQARQNIPAALVLCHSPSGHPPNLETNRNECMRQVFQLGFANRRSHPDEYQLGYRESTSLQQNENSITCKFCIRLDGSTGPGILAVERSNELSGYYLRSLDKISGVYGIGNLERESPRPIVIYLDDKSNSQNLGGRPVVRMSSSQAQRVKPVQPSQAEPVQPSQGEPSKLYLAFCLSSPDNTIELVDNATLCAKFLISMFNLP